MIRSSSSAISHRSEAMKNTGFKTFEEMEVWRAAQELAVSVYRDFCKVKDYSFCDQIKSAAVSISNNIAEGSERTTSTEFSRFLDIAKGSAGEVRSMYRLAVQLGFIDKATADQRCLQCASISKQLGGFAKFLRSK
jgi:four helix bundle protein